MSGNNENKKNIIVSEECDNSKPCKHKVKLEKMEYNLTSVEIVKNLYENRILIPEHFRKKLKTENQGKTRFSITIDDKVVFSGKGDRISKLMKQLRKTEINTEEAIENNDIDKLDKEEL